MVPFSVLLAFFAGICLLISAFFAVAADPRFPLSAKLDKLPRARIPGAVLALLMLVACVPHCEELLGEDSVLVQGYWLRIAVVPVLILLIFFADYLFSRAFAVCCIYAAYLLLREGFAVDWTPLYPVLAVFFFLLGILGIVLGAKPVWMRDWFRASVASPKVRYCFAGCFALTGAASLVLLILHYCL